MAGKYEAPRRKRPAVPLLLLLAVLAALLLAALLLLRPDPPAPEAALPTTQTAPGPTSTPTSPPTEETAPPPPAETHPAPELVASATLSAQGDLLMHEPVISSAKQTDGSYDFGYLFRYLREYLSAFDCSAINLETTLGGPAYPYQGNPEFNSPDALADALKDAGYDMILTANNHASDTYVSGMLRTLEQLRSRGLGTLGTMLSSEEPKYEILDLNGIQVGMLCYTYATNELSEGQPSLNHRAFVKTSGIVNYFLESKLERFFTEVEGHIASMRADGAETIVFYIHWGKEYVTQAGDLQQGIAQRLCDLGVDVIIGGHPHVVQPVELIESSVDPDHRTVCIYSLGNAVSNQMKGVDPAFASGHSEDGALFSVTFGKFSDGTVAVTGLDVLPTWVNRNTNSGKRQYDILPLDLSAEDQWQQRYGLTDEQLAAAKESCQRTMDIVSEGLDACRDRLTK